MLERRDWVSRYLSGERDAVWLELKQLGSLDEEDDRAIEAQAVCDEMARRARQNVDCIVERLTARGYRFHTNDMEQDACTPHYPPSERAEELTVWLTQRFGRIPGTMRAWMHHVGDVWLVGTDPEWDSIAAADPLVVQLEGLHGGESDVRDSYVSEHEAWLDSVAHDGVSETGGFVLPVAPDRLHKDNVSGGPPYGFALPDGCADGLFVAEVGMSFVSYLNWCFRAGGFPWPTDHPAAWRVRSELSKGLLPL